MRKRAFRRISAFLLSLIMVLTTLQLEISPALAEAKPEPLILTELKVTDSEYNSLLYGSVPDSYITAANYLADQLRNKSTLIDISDYNILVDDLGDFFWNLCIYNNPDIFYVNSCQYYRSDSYVTSIMPIYSTTYTQAHIDEYEERVTYILSRIPSGLNQRDKALALHDYLVTHCEYDYTYNNYDAYTALITCQAVCQGYTLAYMDLCKRVGIETAYVTSDKMNHAWCLLKIDGAWYHVDATWNDPLYDRSPALGLANHNNFLRSDVGIANAGSKPHEDWIAEYECTSTTYDSYYWSGITSAIVFTDANTCYYMDGTTLTKRVGDTTTSVSTSANDIWYVWDKPGYYYSGGYAKLAVHDNILYYNSTDTVYAYDISTGEESVLYNYTRGNGYIYGVAESFDLTKLNIEIKTDPNQPTVEMLEVDFKQPTTTLLYGDCDGDGRLSVDDVINMKKYLVSLISNIDTQAADVDLSGTVDINDVILLMKYLVGMDVTLGKAQ